MFNRLGLFLVSLCVSVQAVAAPITFEDVSNKLGFTRGTETWGIAWGDLNNDKWPDLWNSGHRDLPRLYRNTGTGEFDDITMWYDQSSLGGYWLSDTQNDVHGGAWGDYDNDGDEDLLTGDEHELFINQAMVGGFLTQSFLLANQQYSAWNNTDSDRALESDRSCGGVRGGQYILLFDIDGNGSMDELCAGEADFPRSLTGVAADFVPRAGFVNDAAIGDFNNDLRTDIVVTRGSVRPNGASKVSENRIEAWFSGGGRSFTFAADGAVTFLLDGRSGGAYRVADRFELDVNGNTSASARGMSISYDSGSGLWQVNHTPADQAYIRIISDVPVSEPVMGGQTNADLSAASGHGVNTPTGFEWVGGTGLSQSRNCVSVVAADFDNDMDVDLYMACRDGVSNLANKYFDNLGDGTFQEISNHGGEGPVGAGLDFGVADSVITADYDVDGFMDLAVANGLLFYPVSLGGPDTLIRNHGNSNHWIEIDLIGTVSPRAAIGAKVYVTAGGVTQLREQSGGYHRWSQNHSRIHFGLADNTVVDEIRVEWPSGEEDIFTNVAADKLYDLVENGTVTEAVLGGDTSVVIEQDEDCGAPEYTNTLGPALLIWRDCGTENWRVRARSGLSRLTQNRDLTVIGSLVGDANFAAVAAIGNDSNDVLDRTNRKRLEFQQTVEQNDVGGKGFNFSANGQTSTCLDITGGVDDFEVIYLGSTGKRIRLPYDITGLQACILDNDGDGIPDDVDTDDDNDGVLDVNDAFPTDPNESSDTDGDGVGDNADVFPTDPNESADSDGDGIGDNGDIDADNDGIQDVAEAGSSGATTIELLDDFETNLGWTRNPFNTDTANDGLWVVADPGGTVLNGAPFQLGFTTSGTQALVTDSRAGSFVGSFDVDGGITSILSNSIAIPANALNLRFNYSFAHDQRGGAIDFLRVSVFLAGNSTEIFVRRGDNTVRGGNWQAASIDISSYAGQNIQLLVEAADFTAAFVEAQIDDFEVELGSSLLDDVDGDGVANRYDLDSDNDGIFDIVEAGLIDADNNALADDLINGQGIVNNPPDSDGDGLPDYVDLESNNPLNDGTNFDIAGTTNEAFDTNGDGTINTADTNGGVDLDADGIDDLIDADPSNPGSTLPPALDDSCNAPVIDRATDRGLYLWRDCPSGLWMTQLVAGGDPNRVLAEGNFNSIGGFDSLSQSSIESNDVVDATSNPDELAFSLKARNTGVDSFGFQPLGANTCLSLQDTSNVSLFLGRDKIAISSPFNLDTLAACNVPVDPPECGEPVYDRDTEPGVFLWKNCDAGGTDANWTMRIIGGGLPFTAYVGTLTSTNLVTVVGDQIEANDTIDGDLTDNGLDFSLNVANRAIDALEIQIPAGSDTCFSMQQLPSLANVYVGRDRALMNNPFNLEDLGQCL